MSNEKFVDSISFHRREKAYQERYQRGFRRFALGYNLSALEVDLLFALYADAGCDCVTKLCKDINKTKGVVSKACEHLCQLGYLIGKSDENDRRIVHFKLASSARAVILGMVRYTEAMKDLRHLEPNQDASILLLARIDLKKNLIYPIHSAFPLPKELEEFPFCDYRSFWQLTLGSKLEESAITAITNMMSSAALEKDLNEKQSSFQKTVPISDYQDDPPFTVDIVALDYKNEYLMICLKEADAK